MIEPSNLHEMEELLRSFGVAYDTHHDEDDTTSLIMYEGIHKKVVGYSGFLIAINFDAKGNFINIGAYE